MCAAAAASEGDFYPFRNEARDGVETIAALRQRPESNGKIGMYGFSYQVTGPSSSPLPNPLKASSASHLR